MKKVVIDLSGGNHKTRVKAMKIASGTTGVRAVAIGGDDKSKLEVKGEGVDPANLTLLLRKKLARKWCFLRANNPAGVILASVGPVEQKKEETKAEAPKAEEPTVPDYYYHCPPPIMYSLHELQGEPACACSIM